MARENGRKLASQSARNRKEHKGRIKKRTRRERQVKARMVAGGKVKATGGFNGRWRRT